MEIKRTCNYCRGRGVIIDIIKVGDIITPRDGSGMPHGLRHILFNGLGSNPPFNPVKVLHIEGNALFVLPIDSKGKWGDVEPVAAESWMLLNGQGCYGFWVYAPHCHFVE